MGMDGFSIANSGIKEPTSAEMSNRTEQSIANNPANSRQIQGLTDNERIKEREEDDNPNGQKNKREPEQEEFSDGLVEPEEKQEDDLELDIDDIENQNKDFYVKLNINDDIIELYDSSTNRLIETISGSELGELVRKLNMASGIFVNKKV